METTILHRVLFGGAQLNRRKSGAFALFLWTLSYEVSVHLYSSCFA